MNQPPYAAPAPGPYGPPWPAGLPWRGGPVPPPPPGWARLVLHSSYNAVFVLPFGLTVMVDGQLRRSSWGLTVIDLPPGPHHLHVYTQSLRRMGKVDAELSLAPGQLLPLYYRSSLNAFGPGRLGHTPQRSPGVVVAVLVWTVLLVLLVLTTVLFVTG